MRIIRFETQEQCREVMRRMQVDPYGVRIMAPKALMLVLLLERLSGVCATIIKQEMLSLGGDAAIARHALTARTKKTDCLLFGTLAQIAALAGKLREQPFGLAAIGRQIAEGIHAYARDRFILRINGQRLCLGSRTLVMGIVNVTPDSFSGDGLVAAQSEGRKAAVDTGRIVEYAQQMVADGADMLDIGGESSRPGSRPVGLKEEIARVIPAIRACARKIRVPISVDTRKPEVARHALDSGAGVVNDISGLTESGMRTVVARYRAHAVIMHMRGSPRTMQVRPRYGSVTGDIIAFFRAALARSEESGIPRERIILDPGIGFGKTVGHNLEILKGLGEFKILGLPLLVGTSRKSFIGSILGAGTPDRVFGTAASCVMAASNGAHIVRVHDVKAVRQALAVCDAIRGHHN